MGITLLYRLGYFRQHLDAACRQTEELYPWIVARFLIAGVDVWLNTPQPPF